MLPLSRPGKVMKNAEDEKTEEGLISLIKNELGSSLGKIQDIVKMTPKNWFNEIKAIDLEVGDPEDTESAKLYDEQAVIATKHMGDKDVYIINGAGGANSLNYIVDLIKQNKLQEKSKGNVDTLYIFPDSKRKVLQLNFPAYRLYNYFIEILPTD